MHKQDPCERVFSKTGGINMYCPNCGAEVSANAKFCSYCGTALKETGDAVSVYSDMNEYQIVLVSRGSCDTAVLKDLLCDVFGYTYAQASSLTGSIPVQIAQNLNEEEASVIAQMFSEYGAEVTILDENQTYVDLSKNASSSLFGSDGSLLAKAAAVIGALSIANRVTSYKTIKKPSLLERIFRPLFTPKPPKRYVPVRTHKKPVQRISSPRQTPIYKNTIERQIKPVTGHRGGPNGRMKGPGKPGRH